MTTKNWIILFASIGILLIFWVLFFFSTKSNVIKETKTDDFLDIPTSEELKSESISYIDSTYWYVVVTENNINMHTLIILSKPYFDFEEASKKFNGRVFFEFILQVPKESSYTWDNYVEQSYK